MEFTIFKRTGPIFRRDIFGEMEYDGDKGYDTEIEIPDEEVHDDVEDMILNDYFRSIREPENREQLKGAIHKLLQDMDAHDKAVELYFDELRDKYEEDANNE